MFRLFSLGLAAIALTGCALLTQHLTVSVDGYAAPGTATPGKYFLASGSPRVPEGDLQFRSFAGDLEHALAGRGWTRVAAQKDATTLIRFRYGVTDPVSSVREYESPEFGVTGYATTFVNGRPAGPEYTAVTPIYGRTGVSRRTDIRVIYGMNVIVEAYDLAPPNADGTPPQIWKTIVGTSDNKGDLRALLPRMLSVAAPSFGKDTHGWIETEIPVEEK